MIITKEKRTFRILDIAVPVDHRVRIKESNKKDKFLDLAMEHKCDSGTNHLLARLERGMEELEIRWLVWFVGFYGISTFVGYLTPNLFLCKLSVLFKTIQFSISTQFNCQKHFYFKLFKQLYVTIRLNVNTVLMSKNSSISNNPDKHKHAV